jgi:DNA mismatch repair protein MutL
MQAAVMEAYRHLLMHGEFPIAAVWVEVDPEYIDVNIHPTKSQVKFHNPSLAFRAVQAAVRETLELAPWLPAGSSPTPTESVGSPAENAVGAASKSVPPAQSAFAHADFHATQFAKKDFSWRSSNEPSVRETPVTLAALSKAGTDRRSELSAHFENAAAAFVDPAAVSAAASDAAADVVTGPRVAASAETSEPPPSSSKYWSGLEVLSQANLTYIVCQARDKLVFVDQHAAHERVAFERLISAWRGGRIDVQEYLFPLAIDLSPDKIEALQNHVGDLEKLGVYIEALGPTTIGVKAAPTLLKESILSTVLDQMATEALELGGSFRMEKVIGDLCATMACHSVVRAGQALSLEQMQSLLREMDEFPLSSFCPHGRPVSVEYPYAKLEKDFGRTL